MTIPFKSVEKLLKVLEKESKSAFEWFEINDMIVNPDKFQAMISSCDKKENKFELNINDIYPIGTLAH